MYEAPVAEMIMNADTVSASYDRWETPIDPE